MTRATVRTLTCRFLPAALTVWLASAASSCGPRIPTTANVAPGTPYVSWVVMSGDRDNPDQDFVCQSEPRSECVMPASRPDQQVFSDVHFYYHGGGEETKYTGSIRIGFFRSPPDAQRIQTNITVRSKESIANQSVVGIVTDVAGQYEVTFDLVAQRGASGTPEPIRQRLAIVVK